ncbi:hypothetical protein QJQ45_006167 [Haematococcus lacustris]|nr:hypothetical protein QJQ45_006167 [Haematococcus lacustris]
MAITERTTLAYTDGSCIKTSEPAPARVGAGVYIPENNALTTIALNDPENNTINKAELTAIHAALKAGARRIATDSLCSLYQIRRALANPMSLINHRHNDILTDIATLIVDSLDTIQFFKVKAHSGVIGNEGADALAKHAALHPEQANTLGYHPTTRKERGIWLSNGTDGETLAPLPDCRHSVRAHMHSRHKLGLANQDSIYYQMTQDITKAAAKGAAERVMTDTNISIPAQRTALLYRTGGLYNQKLAMRWKQATDDRCPLCGEADSATHLLSGCSATLPLVQERHNGAGRLIAKAISKGTLGGCIRFADTGSWEKGAKDNLDLPNDTLHTTLRALGLKTATTKNTTRPDILMVTPLQKTGKRGKAIKRVTIIEIKYCADSRWAEQLDKALNQHTKLAHTIRKEGHTVEIRPTLLARLASADGRGNDSAADKARYEFHTWCGGDYMTRMKLSPRYFSPLLLRDVVRWWGWYGKETPVLLEVAQRVFCTPATSAGVERLFSVFKLLWSDKRSRLLMGRMWAMAYVYFNTRALKRDEQPFAPTAAEEEQWEEWMASQPLRAPVA